MKFIEKYSDLQPGHMHGNILRSDHNDNCRTCGCLTPFIEIHAECYFCSDECEEKFYQEFFKLNMAKNIND